MTVAGITMCPLLSTSLHARALHVDTPVTASDDAPDAQAVHPLVPLSLVPAYAHAHTVQADGPEPDVPALQVEYPG